MDLQDSKNPTMEEVPESKESKRQSATRRTQAIERLDPLLGAASRKIDRGLNEREGRRDCFGGSL